MDGDFGDNYKLWIMNDEFYYKMWKDLGMIGIDEKSWYKL